MRELKMESIRSVDRAIDIIDAFSIDRPTLTIEQIMKITKLPRATAYRLLYTLERRGLTRYDSETIQYRLGLMLLNYGNQVTSSLDIVKEAEEILTDLHVKTRETILMTLPEGDEMVYVFKKEKHSGLKYSSSVGERRSLLFGALGRVALAFLPINQIERLLDGEIPSWTLNTITDKAIILKQLERIRETHILVETNQTTIGVTAMAAPVFNGEGNVAAIIGLISPSVQMEDTELESAKTLLITAANRISDNLGYVRI